MTFSFCSFFFLFWLCRSFSGWCSFTSNFFSTVLSCHIKKKKSHCQDHCQIAYSFLLPPSKFTLSGLMFNSLIHSELITVNGVQFHCGFFLMCIFTDLSGCLRSSLQHAVPSLCHEGSFAAAHRLSSCATDSGAHGLRLSRFVACEIVGEWICFLCIARWILYLWAAREAPVSLFCMWGSSFLNTFYWRDCAFPIVCSVHPCRRLVDRICLGLFPEFFVLLHSLCVCFYDSEMLFWLL